MSPDSSQDPDRRRHERYDLIAQVHVKNAREDFVLELGNISTSGALLLLGSLGRPSWIDVDRLVDLSIVHPVTQDTALLHGRVMRLQRDEHGLSFYSDKTLCRMLSLDLDVLAAARVQLIRAGVLAYSAPLYQVLALAAEANQP